MKTFYKEILDLEEEVKRSYLEHIEQCIGHPDVTQFSKVRWYANDIVCLQRNLSSSSVVDSFEVPIRLRIASEKLTMSVGSLGAQHSLN